MKTIKIKSVQLTALITALIIATSISCSSSAASPLLPKKPNILQRALNTSANKDYKTAVKDLTSQLEATKDAIKSAQKNILSGKAFTDSNLNLGNINESLSPLYRATQEQSQLATKLQNSGLTPAEQNTKQELDNQITAHYKAEQTVTKLTSTKTQIEKALGIK